MEDNLKGKKKGSYDIVYEAQKVIDEYVDRYFSFPTDQKVKKNSGTDGCEGRLLLVAAALSVILGLVAAALMFWN